MLYHLFDYLKSQGFDLPMMRHLSFRSVLAVVAALLIAIIFGKYIIKALQRRQIGESIRDLGLQGQLEKKGTPTMGGIIIIFAIVIPVLLFARLDNIYTILMLVATLWCGAIGFLDDYIKVFRHNKEGLQGRFKIVGQVGLGLIVGTVMCFSEDIVIREQTSISTEQEQVTTTQLVEDNNATASDITTSKFGEKQMKTTKTTIPFVMDNEFD
jgi:phospho-N-acetylmuramoyl-pentapeptide-transferase